MVFPPENKKLDLGSVNVRRKIGLQISLCEESYANRLYFLRILL